MGQLEFPPQSCRASDGGGVWLCARCATRLPPLAGEGRDGGTAARQCTCAPEIFTTFNHLACSDLMYAANSSGVLPESSAPSEARRSPTSGDFSVCAMSALSFAMIAGGVFAGTKTPYQPTTSKPRTPDSATVGNSGIRGERRAPVMPIARSFPD